MKIKLEKNKNIKLLDNEPVENLENKDNEDIEEINDLNKENVEAMLIGITSGASATTTNQIIKQLLKKEI